MTIKNDPVQIDHGIPHMKIMIAGIICTLVFLYCTYLNSLTESGWFSFFGGFAAIAALVWGSDTVKILNNYDPIRLMNG